VVFHHRFEGREAERFQVPESRTNHRRSELARSRQLSSQGGRFAYSLSLLGSVPSPPHSVSSQDWSVCLSRSTSCPFALAGDPGTLGSFHRCSTGGGSIQLSIKAKFPFRPARKEPSGQIQKKTQENSARGTEFFPCLESSQVSHIPKGSPLFQTECGKENPGHIRSRFA